MQQISKLEQQQRALAQPCQGQHRPDIFSQFWQAHASRRMVADGMFWKCQHCLAPQRTGHAATSKRLQGPCPGKVPGKRKKHNQSCSTAPAPGSSHAARENETTREPKQRDGPQVSQANRRRLQVSCDLWIGLAKLPLGLHLLVQACRGVPGAARAKLRGQMRQVCRPLFGPAGCGG